MDELQISGRRFISSRRLAKENGYHSDYLGQLIRAGKLRGQKVGRAWYVDAESFEKFVSGEQLVSAATTELVSAVALPSQEMVEEPKILSTAAAESWPVPHVQASDTKEHIVAINKQPASTVLRYVEDDEPLLHETMPQQRITRIMPSAAEYTHEVESSASLQSLFGSDATPRKSKIKGVMRYAALALIIFVFSALVSSTLSQTIQIQEGNTASVGYSFNF